MRRTCGPIATALILSVFFALSVSSVALATTRFSKEVTCPVCEFGFYASLAVSTNNFGGQDRDFLSHARGNQVFLFECWTCPRCYYTGFPDDFAKEGVNPELIDGIRNQKVLKPAERIASSIRESEQIPAWIRYDLLSQVLKLRKDVTALRRAWAYLRAAQTQRFDEETVAETGSERTSLDSVVEKIHARYRDRDPYRQTMMAARELERLSADPEGDITEDHRQKALLHASRLYKSRGEDPDVRRVLALLEAREGVSEEVKNGLEALRVRAEREKKYILLAIPLFEQALRDGDVKEEILPNVRYLIGELYRKVGEPEKAAVILAPLAADENLPEWLRSWAQEGLERCGGTSVGRPESRL